MFTWTFASFDKDREEVIKRARENGLQMMINIGSNLDTSRETVKLVEKYPEFMRGAVGIHPHNAQEVDGDTLREIKKARRGRKNSSYWRDGT